MAPARTALVALLSLTALSAGCAESGSSSRRSASTAGVTSGAGGPAANPIPPAPPSQGSALEAYNADLQRTWDAVRPMAKTAIDQQVAARLAGLKHSTSALDLEVLAVSGVTLDAQIAPGLTRLAHDGVTVRLPRQGTWEVRLPLHARITVKLGGFQPAVDIPITLVISGLSVEVNAQFDLSDPTRPQLSQVGRPAITFQVRIDSTFPLITQLTGALTPVADWLAHRALDAALANLLPTLGSLGNLAGPIPGDGAPAWADSGIATPFEEVVTNVDRKLRRHHLPHGTLLCAYVDQPSLDTWLTAYRDGGPGMVGTVTHYEDGGDSAIWTGHYVASQAFRYAVTGESEALDNLAHAVAGVGKLLDVNGGTGLLARVAAPAGTVVGDRIQQDGVFGTAVIDGQTWLGRQGSNGISRDQYSGVFFGLAMAYELAPPLRPDCQRRIEQMLDYLIAHGWVIDEDRPAFTGAPGGSRGPTFWAGVGYQKLAFLLIGHRMNPTKYRAELAAAGGLAESAWLGLWSATFGVDHYYKYNLSHIGLYNYFRLETDAGRWAAMLRGYLMLERYVGHHRNAHFDLIQSTIDPSTRATLFPQTREVIRRFLNRPHRRVAPPVVDLSGVQWVTLTQTGYTQNNGSMQIQTTSTQMPSEPLDITLRYPESNFIWQRDPFRPAQPNEGNAREEKHGLDLVLPYWMGRYYGAF